MLKILIMLMVLFTHPESVLPVGKTVYVSDIGRFGVGDGAILTLKGDTVAYGMVDPKGLAYCDGKIYVADVNRIWEVSSTGAKSVFVSPNGFALNARFLNDLAVHKKKLYVSDTYTNRVYEINIRDKTPHKLFDIEKPNGICFCEDGTMLIITFTIPAKIYTFRKGKLIELYENKKFKGGDGIVCTGNKVYASFYLSGQVVEFERKGDKLVFVKVLKDGLKTPADIGLSKDGILYVPQLESGEIIKINLREEGK